MWTKIFENDCVSAAVNVNFPSCRRDHSSVVANNKMYIMGGRETDLNLMNDYWSLDLVTLEWTKEGVQMHAPVTTPEVEFDSSNFPGGQVTYC